MKSNKLENIKDRLSSEQLVSLYATERLVTALEKLTDAFSTVFTNPFGIGTYLKLLPGKVSPLSYLVPITFFGTVAYFISAKYGTDLAGYISLSFTFILDVTLLIADYSEKIRRRRKQ